MQQLEARQANGGITSVTMAFELLQREVLFGCLPLSPGCLPFQLLGADLNAIVSHPGLLQPAWVV